MKVIKMKTGLAAMDGAWSQGQEVLVGQDMSEERAEGLLKAGLAFEVGDHKASEGTEDEKPQDKLQGDENNTPDSTNADEATVDHRVELSKLDYNEQKAQAKEWGLTFPKTPSKEALLDALVEEAIKREKDAN